MNLVESFFAIITRQAIRRASFTSVRQVTDAGVEQNVGVREANSGS
jgi:hypothetical protein